MDSKYPNKITNEKQKNKVIVTIDQLLVDISQEIIDRRIGSTSINLIPTVMQLESISKELSNMKSELSPHKYVPSYTRQIVDSWDVNSILGEKLLGVAQEYNKLI